MKDLIKKQITVATDLYTLLLEENKALTERDADKVQTISAKKLQHTQTLETLAQEQKTPSATQGLQQEQLQKILTQCKKKNLNNGALIAAGRQSVDTALAILRGQDKPMKTSYGPSGQTIIEPRKSRCLAQT